jgi:hypothetical protein
MAAKRFPEIACRVRGRQWALFTGLAAIALQNQHGIEIQRGNTEKITCFLCILQRKQAPVFFTTLIFASSSSVARRLLGLLNISTGATHSIFSP